MMSDIDLIMMRNDVKKHYDPQIDADFLKDLDDELQLREKRLTS